MLPLIAAEWPLTGALRTRECRWRVITYPQREIFKDFFSLLFCLQVHLDWVRCGGVITYHYLNLKVEATFKGINVASFPPRGIFTFSLPPLIRHLKAGDNYSEDNGGSATALWA